MGQKYCTYCGNKLPDNALVCMNCGRYTNNKANTNVESDNNKKKKKLPGWGIALIVIGSIIVFIFLLFMLLGILFYSVNNEVNDNKNFIDSIFDFKKLEGTIGDTLTGDDLKITLEKSMTYDYIEGEYAKDTPKEGYEYLVFFFEIENIDDEIKYINSLQFTGYEDNYKVPSAFIVNEPDGYKLLSGNLDTHKKMKGYVAFEVSKTWKNFKVDYKSIDDDDIYSFTVICPDCDDYNNDNNTL